jgi:hypothetical protein
MENQPATALSTFQDRDIQEFAAMHSLVANMEVNNKRAFYRIMREPSVTSNTFLPKMGMTLGQISMHMQVREGGGSRQP